MPRILGVNIPDKKRLLISLTYIYGIGLTTSKKILHALQLDTDTRTKNLSDESLIRVSNQVKNYLVEGDLRTKIAMDIKVLKELKTYRGRRHQLGLSVRGQRTSSNCRTRKGKRPAVAGRKKA